MGPRPRGRGNVYLQRVMRFTYELQWGRDRAVAEMTEKCWFSASQTSFNGAATARSRKCHTNPPAPSDIRCFNGAATARSRKWATRRDGGDGGSRFNGAATARSRKFGEHRKQRAAVVASMGPRPRGRGNLFTSTVGTQPDVLQWGRDRAVAEIWERIHE